MTAQQIIDAAQKLTSDWPLVSSNYMSRYFFGPGALDQAEQAIMTLQDYAEREREDADWRAYISRRFYVPSAESIRKIQQDFIDANVSPPVPPMIAEIDANAARIRAVLTEHRAGLT